MYYQPRVATWVWLAGRGGGALARLRWIKVQTARLLVIDDLWVFSAYVRDVAEGLDFDVRIANHAAEFRNIYSVFSPHVICLDMVMPQGGGLELLTWLCEHESKARVLIMSGYDSCYTLAAQRLAQAKGHRQVEVLCKPVDLMALRSALVASAA